MNLNEKEKKDIQISKEEFSFITNFLRTEIGLAISDNKEYLIKSRLAPIIKEHNLSGFNDIVKHIKNDNKTIKEQILNSMVTHETLFFRDKKPFDILKDEILPELVESKIKKHERRIRIWSAACSSGQEPYSIAMMVKEIEDQMKGIKVEITATDIAADVVEKAQSGIYSQFEVQRGLPIQMLIKYFDQEGLNMKVKDDLKSMIKFSTFNLMDDPRNLGKFDVIFCRNVLIYFNNEDKKKVVANFHKIMSDDGVLVLGGTETLFGINKDFQQYKSHRGIYKK